MTSPRLPRLLLASICLFAALRGEAALPLQVQRMLEEGDYEPAATGLASHLDDRPEDREARQTLAQLLIHLGRPTEALEVLAQGLREEPADRSWWEAIGRISQQLAHDGPGVARRAGMMRFTPQNELSEEAVQSFRQEHARRALEAFRACLRLDPRADDVLPPLVEMAEMAGESAVAVEVLEEALDRDQVTPAWVHGQLAHFHLLLGQVERAREHAEQSMEAGESSAAAAQVLRRLAEIEGRPDEAARWSEVGAYLELRPPFLRLPYSAERLEVLRLLAQAPTPDMLDLESQLSDASDARQGPERSELEKRLEDTLDERSNARRKELVASVKTLLETPTEESSQLLAALAYFHTAHGEIEDSAFAELARRGEAPLIKSLMEEADSLCTLRGGAAALAHMRDPEAFERIAPLLEMDTGMWPIHAALALGELGDPRAAPLLADLIKSPIARPDRDDPVAGIGLGRRREEAVLALGLLNTPSARSALEESERDAAIRPFVTAALLRIEPTGRRWKWLLKWARGEDRTFDLETIVRYLEGASLPPEDQLHLQSLADVLTQLRTKAGEP